MFASAVAGANTGLDCAGTRAESSMSRLPMAIRFSSSDRAGAVKAIGSSEQVHVVDALAITGDEGRRSLR